MKAQDISRGVAAALALERAKNGTPQLAVRADVVAGATYIHLHVAEGESFVGVVSIYSDGTEASLQKLSAAFNNFIATLAQQRATSAEPKHTILPDR